MVIRALWILCIPNSILCKPDVPNVIRFFLIHINFSIYCTSVVYIKCLCSSFIPPIYICHAPKRDREAGEGQGAGGGGVSVIYHICIILLPGSAGFIVLTS